MFIAFIETFKRYLSPKLKFYFFLLFKRNNLYHYYLTWEKIRSGKEVKILFGHEGKKEGWLVIGFNRGCDIILPSGGKIKILIPSSAIQEIFIDDFCRQCSEIQIGFLFKEMRRILIEKGILRIRFLDPAKLINKLEEKPEFFLQENYWNNVHSFIDLNPLTIFNKIIFKDNAKNLLSKEEVLSYLRINNFEVIKVEEDLEDLYTYVTAIKPTYISDRSSTVPIKEFDVASDIPVYLYNCDSIYLLNKLKSLPLNKLQHRCFASVIGSLYFINLLPYLRPTKVMLFDINDYQVRYMRVFNEILYSSENFNEFLENFFSRKYNKDIKKFLRSPVDLSILNRNYNRVSDKEIFELTIGKIARGKYTLFDNKYPAITVSNNSLCKNILLVEKEPFMPGPEANIITLDGELNKNFNFIKNILKSAIIKNLRLEDEELINFVSENSGVIYVSNIGESDWLYGDMMDYDFRTIRFLTQLFRLPSSLKEQWLNGYLGFRRFISNINSNFWIIDSAGNIFNSLELLRERSSAKDWLWQKLNQFIKNKRAIEVVPSTIIKGFNEKIPTITIRDYLKKGIRDKYDIIIFHILLGNGVDTQTFIEALKMGAAMFRKIIIIEHDRDSVNFGEGAPPYIIDIRTILKIIRSIPALEKGEIKVCWSGASKRTDNRAYGIIPNFNRNMIITIDL